MGTSIQFYKGDKIMDITTIITKYIVNDNSVLTTLESSGEQFITPYDNKQLPLSYNGETVTFKLSFIQVIENELYVIYKYE